MLSKIRLPKIQLSTKARAEIARDVGVFLAAFLATDVLKGDLTVAALTAAAITAAKATLRQLFPHPE